MLSLAGCAGFTEIVPGAFNLVDQAADDLELETAGEIDLDFHSGGTLFGDGPSYVAVVSGDDAFAVLEGRLPELGYASADETGYWVRGDGEESISVRLSALVAGDALSADGETVTIEHSCVKVTILAASP